MDEDPYINSTATPQFIVNVDDNDDSDIEIIDVQIVDVSIYLLQTIVVYSVSPKC